MTTTERKKLENELKEMKSSIDSTATPEAMKNIFRQTIKTIEAKLSSSQGYNDRLDETLSKDGKESTKKQSLKSRRDESKGMEKSKGKRAYSSDPKMDKSTKPLSSGNPLSKDNELPKFYIGSLVTAPVTKGKTAKLILLDFDKKADTWIYTIEWKDNKGKTLTYESGYQALTLVESPAKKKKNAAGMTAEECRELIEKEKAKSKKAKTAAAKRAKKPEAKKNIERIEKATEVVEKSIKDRKDSGKMPTIAELKALIKEHLEAIKMLEKQLKSLESKTKPRSFASVKFPDYNLEGKKDYIFVQTWNGEGYSDDNKIIKRGKYSKDELSDYAKKLALIFTPDTELEKLDNGWGFEDEDDYGTIQFFEITDKKKQFGIVIFTNVNEVKVLSERSFQGERAAVAELYLESGDYSAEDSENGKGRNFFSQEDIDYNHSVGGDESESDYQFEIINPTYQIPQYKIINMQ